MMGEKKTKKEKKEKRKKTAAPTETLMVDFTHNERRTTEFPDRYALIKQQLKRLRIDAPIPDGEPERAI